MKYPCIKYLMLRMRLGYDAEIIWDAKDKRVIH